MEPVFSTIWIDLGIIALFGLGGGFGLGLLQESGIELPGKRQKVDMAGSTEEKITFYFDLGFIADALVGALAAALLYAINPPTNELELIVTGIIAGLGGAGILKGYITSQKNQELGTVANEAIAIASAKSTPPTEITRGPATSSGMPEVEAQRLEQMQQRVQQLTKK